MIAEILLNKQRCILVPVTSAAIVDRIIERHVRFLRDPEVIRYLRIREASVEYQRKRLLRAVASSTQCAMAVLNGTAEYDTQSIGQRYIGMATLREVDMHDLTAHSGLMIGDKSVWGTGLGKEAKLLQLHYVFMVMKLRWVYSRTVRPNIDSLRMLESTGYVQQGIRPDSRRIKDDFHDELLFGVNMEQWRTVWNMRAIAQI